MDREQKESVAATMSTVCPKCSKALVFVILRKDVKNRVLIKLPATTDKRWKKVQDCECPPPQLRNELLRRVPLG